MEAVNSTSQFGMEQIVIGTPGLSGTRHVRIVHISDTHLAHDSYVKSIPDGDILIHSGDFGHLSFKKFIFRDSDYHSQICELDSFFAKLPHKHKIFVAGNHEINFSQHPVNETQSLMKNGIYLQDSSVVLEGLKFYGSPWNGLRGESYARGFSVPYKDLKNYWEFIPDDTDVLVTHQPPKQLLDLGRLRKKANKNYHCELCDSEHTGYFHIGCTDLRSHIFNKVRPKLHCFGHVHEGNGLASEGGVVFSNAAMKLHPEAKVIDAYVSNTTSCFTNNIPVNYIHSTHSTCSIM